MPETIWSEDLDIIQLLQGVNIRESACLLNHKHVVGNEVFCWNIYSSMLKLYTHSSGVLLGMSHVYKVNFLTQAFGAYQ